MSELMQASHQWSTRPDDERFVSLIDMREHFDTIRNQSREIVVPSRRIHANPTVDNKGLEIVGPNGHAYAPTNWSFGQLAQLSEAPAGYLRTLPSPIAADCINYGLQFKRNIEDVGVLLQRNGSDILRAATGPRYGRIWNADILQGLTKRFGDGVTGDWKVPGEFGKAVNVTKANTTLFAGDRDMFVFLADEQHRIEVPNRRHGQAGQMARGFFMWNSEVGSSTFGLATFLFDYVCCNRIVWGAEEYKEVRIRHTASAPDRYIEEMAPALTAYANSSASNVVKAIELARASNLDKVDDFLATRFGKRLVQPLKMIHEAEEDRPIETLWDVTTAATAYARSIEWQDDRVDLERKAGEVMRLAS
jgi:hypothetical protein